MAQPQNIAASSRRASIAKLTRSPVSASPMMSQSPRFSSKPGAFLNSQFKRVDDSAVVSASASSHNGSEDVFNNSDEEADVKQSAGAKALDSVNRHLNTANKTSMQSEGDDITRDIYKYAEMPHRITRSLSGSGLDSRRGSMASSINVPGGFRRDFILQKQSLRTVNTNLFTKNFVEFLSVYGHFAGEDLEDEDDIACHYKPYVPKGYRGVDEETLLLAPTGADHASYINPKGTATDSKAYFLLVKAFVGTGVLFLPKAFSNGGLLFSVLVLAFFGLLSYWCYLILVVSKREAKVASFGELGFKLYGSWLQQLIFSSIVISQIGFIATYIVFTSQNFQAFLKNVFNVNSIESHWFVIGQLVILIPLSLIRDITKLSLVAVLANFLIMFGLVTILYCIMVDLFLTQHGALGEGIQFLFNQKEFSVFIGIAIFAFEGIGLIIPIQESMIYPNHFPSVLAKVIVTISFVMIFVGSLGYLTYGKDIETVILLNLPQDSPLVMLIQLLYSMAILLSTPIQIFPAIRLIEAKLFMRTGKTSLYIKWLKNLFRGSFVAFTALIAFYGGQNLDRFVSFVGCFACIPLVYMYPPLLHLRACCSEKDADSEKDRATRRLLRVLNYVIVVIGGCALVYTTYDIVRG